MLFTHLTTTQSVLLKSRFSFGLFLRKFFFSAFPAGILQSPFFAFGEGYPRWVNKLWYMWYKHVLPNTISETKYGPQGDFWHVFLLLCRRQTFLFYFPKARFRVCSLCRYLNYGAIGVVIGHEITHGFDDQGRQYDGNGNALPWWSPDTVEAFTGQAQCFIDQYNNYTIDEIVDIVGADNAHVRFCQLICLHF